MEIKMNPFCPKCKKLMRVTRNGCYKCPKCKETYKRGQDVILSRGTIKSEEQIKEELKSMTFEEARKGRGRPELQVLPSEIRQKLQLQQERMNPISRKVRRRITKLIEKRNKNAKKKSKEKEVEG